MGGSSKHRWLRVAALVQAMTAACDSRLYWHKAACTGQQPPAQLAQSSPASASPARLPAHSSTTAWQAAGPPATDQPLAQPSRRTNLPSPAPTSSLTVASTACMPTPPTGRQPRPSPGSRPTGHRPAPRPAQPTNKPSSLTAASAAPPVGHQSWPSPALPPALAQPGLASSAAEAKYK